MIGYLQGEILEHLEGRMLVGIGDSKTSGKVGYSVFVPQSAAYGVFELGQCIELFIYAHVREDSFDLYGFTSSFEKSIFSTLLSVNGIGPKSALGILSAVEPVHLLNAILNADQLFLTQIPGIGKKTAERVVLELKDSIQKKVDQGAFKNIRKVDPLSGFVLSESKQLEDFYDKKLNSSVIQDAKDALIGLGYRDSEIQRFFVKVLKDENFKPKRAEDLVQCVLRQLN